ncbi:MAG: 4-hydroxythreonine-4-phosphate dehydrogenase [Gammaproteobacteria bacterium]|nr:4-hydroxythreonine-4-phosphate dehydrogenase [Gammaproteobacteria bacterium]
MPPDFIFMLTRNDRTVDEAHQYLDIALQAGVKHIGFKNVGLPIEELISARNAIKAGGATSYLEVVSLDRESEIQSAKFALEIGMDYLLGGTHVDDVAPVIRGSEIRYYPFPGNVVGHPSVLEGTAAEITESAMRLCDYNETHGLDLLAYRYTGDVPALMNSVCQSVSKPVVVAGSIDGPERIHAVSQAKASAFTVGTAALDGKFSSDASNLHSQLSAILDVIDGV